MPSFLIEQRLPFDEVMLQTKFSPSIRSRTAEPEHPSLLRTYVHLSTARLILIFILQTLIVRLACIGGGTSLFHCNIYIPTALL